MIIYQQTKQMAIQVENRCQWLELFLCNNDSAVVLLLCYLLI